jgi:hypothetical protein
VASVENRFAPTEWQEHRLGAPRPPGGGSVHGPGTTVFPFAKGGTHRLDEFEPGPRQSSKVDQPPSRAPCRR